MHSVELTLDDDVDRTVRGVWERLRAAGLKSLATHEHPTNRPHLTLATGAALTPQAVAAVAGLPLPAVLDDVIFFGHAVAWRVAAGTELEAMRAAVAEAMGNDQPWVPHVSLALRVKDPTVYEPVLRGLAPARGMFVAARSYDSETRTVSPCCPRPAPEP
ncbi:2'-5' RNA ligase family protein [Symbioplanes lichenis]|uniref:2'-5' RNA ligase family protein n=1 Tax=Symbioplanes lichenis TaxID=1629072 RepID=UPI002739EEAA|nr:2'-5' RNA ligase family protein [Actinoplanes lichenis]